MVFLTADGLPLSPMTRLRWMLSAVLILGLALPAMAQCRLTIHIEGFRRRTGQVYIGLFRQADGFPGTISKAFLHEKQVVPANGAATVQFPSVPLGIYAVSVFDDEDGDGKMKTNWLGIPLEGVGVSNNVRSHFGPPHFKDACFELRQDTTLRITLWFWGS